MRLNNGLYKRKFVFDPISQQDAKALAAQGVGGTEPASQPRSPNILGIK